MINTIIILLTIFTLCEISTPAQNNNNYNNFLKSNRINKLLVADSVRSESLNSNFRNAYFYLTIGAADLLGIGFGYQLNEDYAVGLKWGTYWISGKGSNHGGGLSPNAGVGVGLKVSRKLSFKTFNNLNAEIMLYYRTSEIMGLNPIIKGAAFDINIGHENKIESGFNFIWSLGFVTSIAKSVSPLFMPNLKIGFNINF